MITTPTLRDAAQQALEALVHMTGVLNAAGWATGHADAAVKALRAALAERAEPQWQLERMRHIANEWADMATNGLQWLRNIKEGISNVDDALANMAMCYEHCCMVNDAQGLYGEAAPPAPAAGALAVAVPAGYALVRTPITDDMHVAAAKVLARAHGLEGTPQRMLDSMIAAAPPAPEPTWPEWAEQILKTVREYSGYDGYDDADGVDLHEEVCEALAELTAQIERLEAKAPAPARQEWQPLTQSHVDYVLQYGGRCRDCADENGVCPGSGLPCWGAEKAVWYVLRALNYGFKHGYITATPAGGEKQ